jgi:hypothetical protein
MSWMGVPDIEIQRLNLDSLKNKNINVLLEERAKKESEVKFNEAELPEHARLITSADTQLNEYIESRRIDPQSFPFMVDEDKKRLGVLIPYTYNNKIVGHTTRFLDDRKPKYLNDQQVGYVFGLDFQNDNWQFGIVCEGVLDAISLDAMALMHDDINDKQVQVLRNLHKEIIVVPDQDKPGLKLIDRAIELGFSVSIPQWDDDIKDINDAVKRYGKLATLISIVTSRNSSRIKIKLAKKALKRKIEIA